MAKKAEQKPKIVKCRAKYCQHDNREMLVEEAVKEGSCYYHADCCKTKNEIKEIIDIFSKKINPNVVYAQLQTVIHKIVYEKGLGSELLLFGLKYYISHNITLNYPQGLYYVIQNKDVINEYNKLKAKKIKETANNLIEVEDEQRSFGYKPTKPLTISDLIGEHNGN